MEPSAHNRLAGKAAGEAAQKERDRRRRELDLEGVRAARRGATRGARATQVAHGLTFASSWSGAPGTWTLVGGMKPRKTTGSSTARRPPLPTDSHAEIEDWMIGSVMPRLHPIVQRLDELIGETIPGLQYAIKWKKAYYGLPELGWMIEMVAYDVSVNVVFFGGAELDPPPPLGTTDRSRYVKVTSLEEAQAPMMRKWIEQAGRVRGWQ
jgi:hypothetical protein